MNKRARRLDETATRARDTSSLLKPKENKSLLSEDYFNPDIDLPNLNNKKNPNLMFGENEKFLDPGKRYENKLNRKSEKDKNPNQFQTDQYLGDFRNNGKFVQYFLDCMLSIWSPSH